MAPNTVATYKRAWEAFNSFAMNVFNATLTPPLSIATISLFTAFLHRKGHAPKTISTYLSAISYIHKMLSLPDPTDSFLVKKLTAGAYRLRPSFDLRLPITIPILNLLIASLDHTASSYFERILFQAMFLFAFCTFARIGEITTSDKSHTVIQLSDICFYKNKVGKATEVGVTFTEFKHNVSKQAHTISFNDGYAKRSAVQALSDYLNLRGQQQGALFCEQSGKPVARAVFDRQLHRSLQFCRLDSSRYKGHSFRIGAATLKSQQGFSDSQIRAMGRWHSNAFRKYIRVNSG